MAVLPVPPSPTPKRPHELSTQEPAQQKYRRIEENDLPPLFSTVQATLIGCVDDYDSIQSAVEVLSQSHDVFPPFQQISFRKIRDFFKERFAPLEEYQPHEKKFKGVLRGLYRVTLRNSRIHEMLVSINTKIPALKVMLARPIREEIHSLLREARALLRNQADPELMMRRLDQYRTLKQYLNPDENRRVIDLAEALRVADAPTQYPLVLDEYPEMIKEIQALKHELNAVSAMIQKLHTLKLELQEKRAVPKKENPLETRFLNAYGAPLYHAFALHGWDLLWNSIEAGAVEFKTTSSREILDHAAFNQFWAEHFPDFELSEWILLALESKTEPERDELERKLEPLQKIINGIQTTPLITNKAQARQPHEKEMLSICLQAFQPSFKQVTELKAFLDSRIKR